MALWTPYVQEAPLDLTVKPEVETPAYNCLPNQPCYGYVPYSQPSAFRVPSSQTSPYSNCSEYGSSYSSIPARSVNFAPSPPTSPDSFSLSNDEEYAAYERDTLNAMAEKNGGTLVGNNPRMRRAVQTTQTADDSYRKQRERNNLAAKQSRDRRKMREVRLSLQVAFLTKKLADLKAASGVCVRCHQELM